MNTLEVTLDVEQLNPWKQMAVGGYRCEVLIRTHFGRLKTVLIMDNDAQYQALFTDSEARMLGAPNAAAIHRCLYHALETTNGSTVLH